MDRDFSKVYCEVLGQFTIPINLDFGIAEAGWRDGRRLLYASVFDFQTKIDKVNADLIGRKDFGLAVNFSNNSKGGKDILSVDKDFSLRRTFKQVYKEQKRTHLTFVTDADDVFFYRLDKDFTEQLRDFFIVKHRMMFGDNDLNEVLERFGTQAKTFGHNDMKLSAYIFDMDSIKTDFLIDDPEFLSHLSTSIDFIKENANEFREALKENVRVLYNPVNTYNIEKYMVQPFAGQEVLWGAGIEVLKKNDFLYVAADMGLGKTLSSLFINDQVQITHREKKFYTSLIVAPTTTMRGKDGGWRKEINDIMTLADGTVRPHEIVMITSAEGSDEFIRTMKRIDRKNLDKNYFIVVSKEALKLSHSKEPAYNFKRAWTRDGKAEKLDRPLISCPSCGKPQYYGKDHLWMSESNFYDNNGKPKNRIEENKNCCRCGGPLWGSFSNKKSPIKFKNYSRYNEKQLAIIEKLNNNIFTKRRKEKIGLHKISIVDYIKAMGIKFDSIIIDEFHEGNKVDSLIGRAQALALQYGKKKIVLSGTSNAGYASNMYNILRATMSRKLVSKGLVGKDWRKKFVEKYGTYEREIKEDYDVKYGKTEKRTTAVEKEGISSAIFTDFLAENYIFFTYKDIKKKMEDIKEEYIQIDQNEYVEEILNRFEREVNSINTAALGMIKDSIIKHMANQPVMKWEGAIPIERPFGGGTEYVNFEPFDEELSFNIRKGTKLTPKDEVLLDLIKDNLYENRKVCVFTYFTGGNGTSKYMKDESVTIRIKKVLEGQGFRVAYLTTDKLYLGSKSINTTNAERQVRLHEEQGNYDILICNPKVVNVGINLRFIPTYINYMPSYQVAEVSQANRRGYRINTTVENRIYHLYYGNTVERDIIERFQKKRLESKAMEGVFDVNIESDKEEKLRSHSKSVNKLVKELEGVLLN